MASAGGARRHDSALDVIFTCDICQASISDIYSKSSAGAVVTDFQDGRPRAADRHVTCLWLTACMHLTCGRHLEGGGAPFHPQGEHPQAPCPFCVRHSNDRRPKTLYAIRGLQRGNFDPEIPELLFRSPPMKLSGQGVELEALKFQYMSLIRYGTSMSSKCQALEQAARKAEHDVKRVEAENFSLTKENRVLRAKLASLEGIQADVARWNERMPRLTHYLKQWPLVMGEVNEMRGQLELLGYVVPKRDYAYHDEAEENAKQTAIANVSEAHTDREPQKAARVPTDNTQTEYGTAQTHLSEHSSDRKRKLSEYDGRNDKPDYDEQALRRGEHCAPEPRGVVGNNRASLPRNDRFHNQFSGSVPSDTGTVPQMHMVEAGGWQQNYGMNFHNHGPQTPKPPPRRYEIDKYMTGAADQSAKHMRPSRQHQPAQQSGQAAEGLYPPRDQRYHNSCQDENAYHIYDKTQRHLKLPTPHQVYDPTVLGVQSQSALNRQQTDWPSTSMNNNGLTSLGPIDHSLVYGCKPLRYDPATPLPRRQQGPHNFKPPNKRPSPFFTRIPGSVGSGVSHVAAGLSANARMGTVSKIPDLAVASPSQKWVQPRSLNGLSFIDIPHDRSRNEPLIQSNENESQHRTSVNGTFIPHDPMRVDQGIIKHSKQGRLSSSYFNSMPPPQRISPISKAYRTPRMPPISQFALRPTSRRAFTRDDALNMVGGSGRQSATSFYQNQAGGRDMGTLPDAVSFDARNIFSSAGGRRSVRR